MTLSWPNQEPRRTISLNSFYIDTFKVTNAEYAAFLSHGNASHYWVSQDIQDNGDGTYSPVPGKEEEPVANVAWESANAFSSWVEKRLPTETEWEAASRGSISGPNYHFPWGNSLPSAVVPTPLNFANLVGEAIGVENYSNGVTIWENDNGDNDNPTGPASSPYTPVEPPYRVIRGGNFQSDENTVRNYYRSYADPWSRTDTIGFRCVVNYL